MPILVQHGDSGLLGGAAYSAGNAEGTARLAEQLRAVGAQRDAMILEDQFRQQAARNARPSYYERNQGGPAQQHDGGVQTFVNNDARAERAQREEVYGSPPEEDARQKTAAIFENRAKSETNPDIAAANKLIAQRTLSGGKVDDGLMKLAGFKTPADVTAAAESHRKEQEGTRKADLEREKLTAKESAAPTFKTQGEADAHEIAWKLPAKVVADSLRLLTQPEPPTDLLTGKPDPRYQAAITVQRMLETGARGKSVAEIQGRIRELEAAGAPPQALAAARQQVAQVFAKASQVADVAGRLIRDSAAQVASGKIADPQARAHQKQFMADALKQAGISVEDYAAYLKAQEEKRGLRPSP